MPPLAAVEARVLDTLLSALGSIGTPPGNWLTDADVREGVPGDPVLSQDQPVVWLQFVRTEPGEGEAGTSVHWWRLHFTAWVVAETVRGMLDAKADVVRALFNSEGTVSAAHGGAIAYPGAFEYRNELAQTGVQVGALSIFLDVEIPHAAP